jgi:hypothetical protein
MRYSGWMPSILVCIFLFSHNSVAQRVRDTSPCGQIGAQISADKFAAIPDASTTILSAKVIPAGGDGSVVEKDFPEFCRVEGVIEPTVGFLLRMPTKTWNGKFMMGGCGGPCGNFLTDRIDPALVKNYAVVVTDMGHKGGGWEFGYNNIQGQIDFGYRATHVTVVASKVIIEAFYGKKAEKNYYWGCSTGGRQGLIEAQRFPHDFDAIAAGAPPWNQLKYQPFVPQWEMKSNTGDDGKPILSRDKLPMIHAAVLKECDGQDGLKDNILEDPKSCKWTPQEIECTAGAASASCLTHAEVMVVQRLYDGPRNSRGEQLFGGHSRGSELKWLLASFGDNTSENTTLNYLGFCPAPGPQYTGKQFDYDKDPDRLMINDPIYYHTNPDLTEFKASGGKLILYQGFDDGIPILPAMKYYELTTKTMGGRDSTMSFFRMFLIPGMDHCRYGIGGGEIDWIGYLERWAEKGEAPDSVLAYHMKTEPYPSQRRPGNEAAEVLTRMARHPLDPSEYDRSRPVFAYPDTAFYSGKGDPTKPETWIKKSPQQ